MVQGHLGLKNEFGASKDQNETLFFFFKKKKGGKREGIPNLCGKKENRKLCNYNSTACLTTHFSSTSLTNFYFSFLFKNTDWLG